MLNITNESRVLQGPWTTLVKGRGLGSNTKKFSADESGHIKEIFEVIDKTIVKSNSYNKFSKNLCYFILDYNDPDCLIFQRKEFYSRIDKVISSLKVIDDPYLYVSASAIFFEVIGKLGLDPNLWANKGINLVEDALAKLGCLPISSQQECYKVLQVYGNLFLGVAHLGQVDKLIKGHVDYVNQALDVINGLEGVWHRGRGVAAFLNILALIGLNNYAIKPEHNYLKELVIFMDKSLDDQAKVDENPNEYVFSILMMINCIGVLDKLEYLEYKRDWVKLSVELIETLPIELKAIFCHYYLSALDNFNLSEKCEKSPKDYLLSVIESLSASKGNELDYMAYTYLVDIAHKLDLVRILPKSLANDFVDNISTQYDFKNGCKPNKLFYRSGFMRSAYAVVAMSQMGCVKCLLDKNNSDDSSLIERIIENHIDNWGVSDDSFTILNHALIDLSLSQRGENIPESEIDRNVVLHRNKNRTRNIQVIAKEKTAIHAFFPGMNSRRYYSKVSRDLYDKGNSQVRAIFEDSYEILYGGTKNGEAPNFSQFFFEDAVSNDDISEKWNCIGSSMTVYNLALFEHLKTSRGDFYVNSVGGESYGMIAAAIASNALSLEDGLKIANSTLGTIYKCAHSNNFGLWHIVSLSGNSIRNTLKEVERSFPEGIDVFRWQTLSDDKEEVHVYINQNIFEEIKNYIKTLFGSGIFFKDFKRPTIEIIHSPKLAPARIDITNFMIDENISFSTPDIPIVANNVTNIASSKNEVRNLILDMVNTPMYSAQSFKFIKEKSSLNTDIIVELGYGQKTRRFIVEHGIKQPFFEYYGDDHKLQQIANNIKSI